MSNTLNIALVITGMVSGSVQSALGGVQKTLGKLGDVTKELAERQNRLGNAIKGLDSTAPQMRHMQDRYRQIGMAVDLVTSKQKRLNDLIAQGAAIKTQRDGYKSSLFEATGQAVAVGAPVLKSVQLAGGFQDQLRDISITGEFSVAEEARLGKTIRDNALRFNQTQEDLSKGIGVLVAGGISSAKELSEFAPVIAKGATATRASVDDLGSVLLAMRDNLKISAKDSESALNMLAYTGKKGQFELKDQAKWLPSLAPQMAALGLVGKEAVAEIGAALQIARKGAGTNDEAANNFRNFLAKVTSPDTIKDFAKAGINLKGDLIKLREQGMTPMQGMLQLITQYMGTKGPEAAGQFTKALAIKNDAEREAAIARLKEAYKLGELFQDMQAMNFIKPAIANAKELVDIKKGALAAGGDDLLGKDLAKRMEGFNERWKNFTIGMKDLGISLGNTLLPPLISIVKLVSPLISMVGTLVNTFPRLTGALVGIVSGLLLGKMAVLSFLYLKTMVTGFFLSIQTFAALASAKLAIFRTATMLAGGAMRTFSLLSLLTNPVGLIIGGIALAVAGAVFLIYKYWKPISGFFKGIWQGLKEGLKGLAPAWDVFKKVALVLFPILIPLKWIFNLVKALFKPVDDVGGKAENMGLRFGKAIGRILSSVLQMPAKMLTAGANIIDSLFKGMMSKIEKPINVMKGLATRIRGFLPFSPAKEGALRDINRIRLVETIAESITPAPMVRAMKAATAATMIAAAPAMGMTQPADITTRPAVASLARPISAGQGSAPITIHFAPQITVQGGGDPASVKGAVMEASRASQVELERMIERILAQKQRRSF